MKKAALLIAAIVAAVQLVSGAMVASEVHETASRVATRFAALDAVQ